MGGFSEVPLIWSRSDCLGASLDFALWISWSFLPSQCMFPLKNQCSSILYLGAGIASQNSKWVPRISCGKKNRMATWREQITTERPHPEASQWKGLTNSKWSLKNRTLESPQTGANQKYTHYPVPRRCNLVVFAFKYWYLGKAASLLAATPALTRSLPAWNVHQ